jgi:DNA polymerase I-like protein with 3'-5' exonuclease and polymerase domains
VLQFNPADYAPRQAFIADTETNGLLGLGLSKMHCLVLIDLVTKEELEFSDQPGETPIAMGLMLLRHARLIVGQNWIRYDDPVIRFLYPDWDTGARIIDTLILSRLLWGDLREIDADKRKRAFERIAEEQKLFPHRPPKNQPYALPGKLTGMHGLEAWGYRLGHFKGDYGKQENAWEVWTKEMQDYCVQDCRVTLTFFNTCLSKKPLLAAVEMEHEFAEILAFQERRGFAFDERKAVKLLTQLVAKRAALEAELAAAVPPWWAPVNLTPYDKAKPNAPRPPRERVVKRTMRRKRPDLGPSVIEHVEAGAIWTPVELVEFNPKSRQQVGERLQALYGWKPAEKTDDGHAKVDETILGKLPYSIAPMLAEYFTIVKRVGQLSEGEQAWLKLVRNGRIHGSVNTIGAVTRRCTHSNPNVAQVPSSGSAYGHDCRELFTTTPGWILVGADASGLELRLLAHFLAVSAKDGGAYAKVLLEGDVHWATVVGLGLAEGSRIKDDPYHDAFRDAAKTFIYGFLYGAGDLKAGAILWDLIIKLRRDGLEWESHSRRLFGAFNDIAPDEACMARAGKRAKTRFLNKTPAIKKLREAVSDLARTQGFIRALDKSPVKIRSAHSALNTLLQSAGALVVKMATVILHRLLHEDGLVRGVDFAQVAHIHDELQIEARTQEIANHIGKRAQEAMTAAGEHYRLAIRIDGEFKIGETWAQTH